MARPKVNTSPVADRYANKADEHIVEFNSGEAGGPGGLISFKRQDDGSLGVSLYRLDEGVTVAVEGQQPEGISTRELISWWNNLSDEERVLLVGAPADEG